MNALALTHRDFINTMAKLAKPVTRQTGYISATIFTGSPLGPRYIVLVVPDGSEFGELYEVYQRGLDALRGGMSPEEMELEPFVPDTDEDDEPDFSIRDHTRAMADSGAFGR